MISKEAQVCPACYYKAHKPKTREWKLLELFREFMEQVVDTTDYTEGECREFIKMYDTFMTDQEKDYLFAGMMQYTTDEPIKPGI